MRGILYGSGVCRRICSQPATFFPPRPRHTHWHGYVLCFRMWTCEYTGFRSFAPNQERLVNMMRFSFRFGTSAGAVFHLFAIRLWASIQYMHPLRTYTRAQINMRTIQINYVLYVRKLKQNMTPGPVRLPIQFGHSIVNAQMKCIGIINKGNWIILFCLELKSKSILPCIFLSTLHCSQKKVLHCSLMNIKCREIKELVLDKIFRSHSAYVSFVNRIAPFSDMETTPCPHTQEPSSNTPITTIHIFLNVKSVWQKSTAMQ